MKNHQDPSDKNNKDRFQHLILLMKSKNTNMIQRKMKEEAYYLKDSSQLKNKKIKINYRIYNMMKLLEEKLEDGFINFT